MKSSGKYKYVYAMCGDSKYIDQLNLSIKLLKQHTSFEIIVLTNEERNNGIIHHDNVIDIKSPEDLTNHQSSIYLKTRLNKVLKPGSDEVFCYLDTDVFSVNDQADKIFEHYSSPVTFAPDSITSHHNISLFSEFAVNSPVWDNYQRFKWLMENGVIQEFYDSMNQIDFSNSEFTGHLKEGQYYDGYSFKTDREQNLIFVQKFKNFELTETYYSLKGEPFMFYKNEKRDKSYWVDNKGYVMHDNNLNSEFSIKSNFLTNLIKRKFQVSINNPNWKHWNGGVFLFGRKANAFFNYWHEATIEIFADKLWKVRDQGTLAATIWKFGLPNHDTLPFEYNFIYDPASPNIKYQGQLKFKDISSGKVSSPHFVHFLKCSDYQDSELWLDIQNLL